MSTRTHELKTRRACPGDWWAIESLQRNARRKSPPLWWWEEHLADDLFVVVERESSVVGALFVWPDESPVAWMRLAALADELETDQWLSLALPPVLDSLRRRGAQALAWMDYDRWAEPHIQTRGFKRLTDVITLVKFDRALPSTNAAHVYVHPASDADIPAVAAVDRSAFTPHWRHSEFTLLRRAAASSCFVVAEVGDQIVGYAEGDSRQYTAHINRLAVHPAHQGHGVGASLLTHILRTLWRLGAEQVTLNTQADNHYSQRLYHHFGFEPTGDVVIAWELPL
jgi:ribosomal protein S18 acetylase RimI-like enzyme